MLDVSDLEHASSPPAESGAALHALTVACAVIVALSLVTELVGMQVGASAAVVLAGQGRYALLRRTSPPPRHDRRAWRADRVARRRRIAGH